MKDRFNDGLTSNLHFWRDNLGDEVDVIIDYGTYLAPVEVKSGETLNPDYFLGLKKWKKVAADRTSASYLVYGGSERLISEGISIVPWRRTAEFIATKAG
jgi:predicted AAA+ superfamily ATPase